MSIAINNNIASEIAPYIYLLYWDTYICVIFVVVFVGSHSKKDCSELASSDLYIAEYLFWVRQHIDVIHDIIFSRYLTATWTITFGYIKCTLIAAFDGSFLILWLVIISDRKWAKNATKNTKWVCHCKFLIRNIAHCIMSVSWKMRGWSMKSKYL